MINPRYNIGVTFKKVGASGDLQTVGKTLIDATEILAWPAREVDALTRAFDDQEAPSIENLPLSEAKAIRAAHDGPIEVTFGLIGYLASLQVIDWERLDLNNRTWLDNHILAQARERIGFTPTATFSKSYVYEIDRQFVSVFYDGKTWRRAGFFEAAVEAQSAAGAALEEIAIAQKPLAFDLSLKINGFDAEGEGLGPCVRGFILETSREIGLARNSMVYVIMPRPDRPDRPLHLLRDGDETTGIRRKFPTDTIVFRDCRWIDRRTIAAKSFDPSREKL